MNYISQNIKYLRVNAGLSQTAFGGLFGITRDNIASYERGSEPSLQLLQKIVNYFHIEIEDIINSDLSEGKAETTIEFNEPEPEYKRPDVYETIDALKKVIATQEKTISALEMVIANKSKEENNSHVDTRSTQV